MCTILSVLLVSTLIGCSKTEESLSEVTTKTETTIGTSEEKLLDLNGKMGLGNKTNINVDYNLVYSEETSDSLVQVYCFNNTDKNIVKCFYLDNTTCNYTDIQYLNNKSYVIFASEKGSKPELKFGENSQHTCTLNKNEDLINDEKISSLTVNLSEENHEMIYDDNDNYKHDEWIKTINVTKYNSTLRVDDIIDRLNKILKGELTIMYSDTGTKYCSYEIQYKYAAVIDTTVNIGESGSYEATGLEISNEIDTILSELNNSEDTETDSIKQSSDSKESSDTEVSADE